jgi:hypothetical protein
MSFETKDVITIQDQNFAISVSRGGALLSLGGNNLTAGDVYDFTATIYVDGIPQNTSARWTVIGNVRYQAQYQAEVDRAIIVPTQMNANPTTFMFAPAIQNKPLINFSIRADMRVISGPYAGLSGQETKDFVLVTSTTVEIEGDPSTGEISVYKADDNNWYISFGNPLYVPGVQANFILPEAYTDGSFGLIQLMNSLRRYKNTTTGVQHDVINTNGRYWLDAGQPREVIYTQAGADKGDIKVSALFKDSPRMQCPADTKAYNECYLSETYNIYPMFQPKDGQWVPVQAVAQWSWSATANWDKEQWVLTGYARIKPRWIGTFSFPLWDRAWPPAGAAADVMVIAIR